LDSTFVRSCEEGERHLEVRIGNVETTTGRRQVFGAVAKTGKESAVLIRRSLDAVGRTEGTALTAFTDGCPGLRRLLLKAGIDGLPILGWFHVAMRLQHLTQVAGALSSVGPKRAVANALIAEEVERLRWRLWYGKAKDVGISIERIRAADTTAGSFESLRIWPTTLRLSSSRLRAGAMRGTACSRLPFRPSPGFSSGL
jgi:hypothetical protein